MAIADFDGDGDADILLGQARLTLYANDGAGGFAPVWQADNTESDHQGVAVADVNGDGLPDVAEIDFSRGKVWLYLSRDGALDPVPAWSYDGEGAGTALAFGDVDGDGLPDLAVGFSGSLRSSCSSTPARRWTTRSSRTDSRRRAAEPAWRMRAGIRSARAAPCASPGQEGRSGFVGDGNYSCAPPSMRPTGTLPLP